MTTYIIDTGNWGETAISRNPIAIMNIVQLFMLIAAFP